jgi:hypothetical protein
MDNVWFLAATWLGLALVATLLAIWLRISTALSEIVVGIVAQLVIGVVVGPHALGSSIGLSHGIIDTGQYSHLVAAVIASAVIPTLVANAFFMPGHLRPIDAVEVERARSAAPKEAQNV